MGTTSLNPAEQTVGEDNTGRQNSKHSSSKRSATPQAIWDEIRMAYEMSRETLAQLAIRFGVSVSAIQYRAKKEGWLPRRPRKGAVRTGAQDVLIRRLYRTIDHKLAQLEERMANDDDKLSIADHERETRALGQLIRNFEKVSGLEAEQCGGADHVPGGKSEEPAAVLVTDPERLRNELAERILRLREKKIGEPEGDQ